MWVRCAFPHGLSPMLPYCANAHVRNFTRMPRTSLFRDEPGLPQRLWIDSFHTQDSLCEGTRFSLGPGAQPPRRCRRERRPGAPRARMMAREQTLRASPSWPRAPSLCSPKSEGALGPGGGQSPWPRPGIKVISPRTLPKARCDPPGETRKPRLASDTRDACACNRCCTHFLGSAVLSAARADEALLPSHPLLVFAREWTLALRRTMARHLGRKRIFCFPRVRPKAKSSLAQDLRATNS